MAPEQAQGLETLDARADVWALAAITYECLTGKVPFQGINGPSILLAILTKDPVPPTQAGAGGPVPIPPTVDELMEVALAKNPNIRVRTVGELADAMGRAYGLSGDHLAWAFTPQSVLGQSIQAELPRMMATKPAASAGGMGMMSDPFAPPPPAGGMHPMDRAFAGAAQGAAGGTEEFVMGVPKGPPKWLVPAIIGAVAVVAGIVVAVLLIR
jgi:serine/threonine-protein kinase